MIDCLFLLSATPDLPPLRHGLVGAWPLDALREPGPRGLAAHWHRQPADRRLWLLDAPADALAGLTAALAAHQLDDAPVLWWVAAGRTPDMAERDAFEAQAAALGVHGVLYATETERHGPCIERALALSAAPAGGFARVRQLRREQQALQASLDNLPAPIFVKNAEGVYTECNLAFQSFLGLPRDRIVGHTVHDIAPPALAQVYDQADRALLAQGGRQIYEAQVRWADGSLRDVIFHKAVFHDAQGQAAGQAGAIFDITERRQLELRLRTLAETDELTGLLNRRSFVDQVQAQFAQRAAASEAVALMLFDVDHFKQINDTHGHAAGDALLRHIAHVVRSHLRSEDCFARLGGDEFAIALHGPAHAERVADRLPALVAAEPLWLGPQALQARISLGVAVVPAAEHTVDSALHLADLVLYEAKRLGRNRSVVMDTRADRDRI